MGVVSEAQRFRGPLKAKGGQVVTEAIVRPVEHVPHPRIGIVQIPTHPRVLGTLAGEDKSDPAHPSSPPHRTRAPAHVSPAPKPTMRTRSPSLTSPAWSASSRATGTEAADVLPYR